MVRVFHQRNKCIGCNACVEAAKGRWRMSRKDGKSILIGGKENKGIYSVIINDFEEEEMREAAKNCPSRIIRVEAH